METDNVWYEHVESCLLGILNERRSPKTPAQHIFVGTWAEKIGVTCSTSGAVLDPVPIPEVTPEMFFAGLGLGLTDPDEICRELSRRLGITGIPSNFRRQIASTYEYQDLMPPANKSAVLTLTVRAFAQKVSVWIAEQYPGLHPRQLTR